MSQYSEGKTLAFEAGESLTTAQNCFVTLGTDKKILLTNGPTEAMEGILQDKPASGSFGAVMIDGVSKVIAGTNFAGNNIPLTSDASGHAVPCSATNDLVRALSQEASAAALNVVEVKLVDLRPAVTVSGR